MSNFQPFRIKDITRETSKAVVIEFDVPSDLKSAYSFVAGQYITVKTTLNGKELRRSYSICSTPKSNVLKVAVKEVQGGTFSVHANNKLQVNDVLEVHPPEGKFVLSTEPTNQNNYCAFAAGSGITPVLSMVTAVLEEEPKSTFVLVYGNRAPIDTIFFKELLRLQSIYEKRLFVQYVFSRTQEENSLFGRIEKSTINHIVLNKFKDTVFKSFFLCGPEEMINTVSAILRENGVSKEVINFELFTASSDGAIIEADLDGKSKITVLVDDERSSFVMDQKRTILDATLAEDIDAPYSCQGGVCSSCICRVTEGKVVMEKNSILTDGELAEGLILACQAHPVSKTVSIDFDDV